MTAAEIANLIGKRATLRTKDGWEVPVTIKDARTVYGREDVLVVADNEETGRWVAAERVTITGGE